jgi:hypothetical protein
MAELVDDDLQNSRFLRVNLNGSRFHGCGFRNVKITDAFVDNLEISAYLGSLVVNEVDVSDYVRAELARRHPELRALAARDPDGLRAAWRVIEDQAAATLARARALPETARHESVDGEWSYVDTLRHLVFATDRWITGPVLDDPEPFHSLGMPMDDPEPWRERLDIDASPSLDEVLAIRRARMDSIVQLLADATDADVAREVASPNGGQTTVAGCIGVVLNEEWAHNRYAKRDLDVLGAPRT